MSGILSQRPRRVAVFRALNLGDMLCAVPALRALRAGLPGAEIVLVGLPWAREFAARFGEYFDGFRVFPGYPGLPEQPADVAELPSFFRSLRAERFDLAIQMHGSGAITNAVVERFGARVTAGFYDATFACPDRATFLPYPRRGLELRRLLALVEHLGIEPRGEQLELPISHEERSLGMQLPGVRALGSRPYACIHCGASVPERRWGIDRFAEVADALSERGLAIVLTGSAAEVKLTSALAGSMSAPAVDLAGKTTLGTLAAVLDRARLLVCNDTGVSHVADALCVPSVVVSTGDNPDRWAPVDRRLHRVLCNDAGVPVRAALAEADDLLNHTSRFATRVTRPVWNGRDAAADLSPRSFPKSCGLFAS